MPLLYSENRNGLETATVLFSDREYLWTDELGNIPWIVEAIVTTELSTHREISILSSCFMTW